VFLSRLLAAILLLGGMSVAGNGVRAEDADNGKVPVVVPPPERHPEPTYVVHAGVDGEIYPVFANYFSLQRQEERRAGTIAITVANPTDAPLRSRLSVQVPGWSDEEIQAVELSAGETRTFLFAPSFNSRLYTNVEIAAATAVISAVDDSGKIVFSTTVPVRMRATDDMYWGDNFKFARFIASWVTPHDPLVEEVLSRAKEYMEGRRLPGYEPWKSADQQQQSTYAQAKAIYRALQERGLSYVKSSITFGDHSAVSERVRMPYESLKQVSANCIDGAVIYAALFENLAMDPVIVVVPGHAFVGVRVAQGSDRYLYIDTVLTGRDTFENAVQTAQTEMTRFKSEQITRIAIPDARQAGIYPMPTPDKLTAGTYTYQTVAATQLR
jgi:hypothetical protein